MSSTCRVSVIIKALNEQAGIARAVASALAAVADVGGGEVVLADSGSTDRTVAVACAFPIRVVQLLDRRERSCGIGPQLGWQHARGEYVYLMDGDMALQPGFLGQALAFLAQHPEVAGVGGRVAERNQESLEYREREARAQSQPHRVPGPVDRLDGGGLYRRLAIQEVGYLSDRNLHSYEEFDLAARLRAQGWKLWRLPVDAVSHRGHADPALSLLLRRWRGGYAWGGGELLRAALGQPWLGLVLADVRELRLYALVWAWWLALAGVALAPLPAGIPLLSAVAALLLPPGPVTPSSWAWRPALLALLALAPWLAACARKRSVARGSHALLSWCVNAAGLARGLLRGRKPPASRIASRILREPYEPPRPPPADGGSATPARRTPPPAHRRP